MDTVPFGGLLSSGQMPLLIATGALVIALVALFLAASGRGRTQDQVATLRERSDSLWREIDDIRVAQFNRPAESGPNAQTPPLAQAQYHTEVEAYNWICSRTRPARPPTTTDGYSRTNATACMKARPGN